MTTKSSEIRRAFTACGSAFAATAVFSFFLNLLVLVVPLYMLQVFDRVLSSRSESTLLMLTILAGFMLLILGLLETVRARVLVRTGVKFEGLLKDRVFAAVFERSIGAPGSTRTQALQDLDSLRQFLTGSGLFALLDAPWTPIFIGVIYLTMHHKSSDAMNIFHNRMVVTNRMFLGNLMAEGIVDENDEITEKTTNTLQLLAYKIIDKSNDQLSEGQQITSPDLTKLYEGMNKYLEEQNKLLESIKEMNKKKPEDEKPKEDKG